MSRSLQVADKLQALDASTGDVIWQYVRQFPEGFPVPGFFNQLRNISIRLGAPAIPGQVLRFTGRVARVSREGSERLVEVEIRAANQLGDHVTGTVSLTLPDE